MHRNLSWASRMSGLNYKIVVIVALVSEDTTTWKPAIGNNRNVTTNDSQVRLL